jgi:hypothetical protein
VIASAPIKIRLTLLLPCFLESATPKAESTNCVTLIPLKDNSSAVFLP